MPLTENIVTLRAITVEHPNPGPGGMYATSAGDGKDIETAAEDPEFVDRQRVRI